MSSHGVAMFMHLPGVITLFGGIGLQHWCTQRRRLLVALAGAGQRRHRRWSTGLPRLACSGGRPPATPPPTPTGAGPQCSFLEVVE
jgi:hypothetical protein